MNATLKKQRILIAEDDPVVRKATAHYLQSHGYEVDEASDGDIALKQLRQQLPSVLLTDLRMPGMDGLELLRVRMTEFPSLAVIVISGMGSIQDAIEALRLGAFDYITKPVPDMALILHSVEMAIRHSELLLQEQDRHQELEGLVQQRTLELLQKNAQLEKEMKQRQMQEGLVLQAKQEWERTVDAMPEMIAIIDRNYQIVRINRTLCEKLACSYKDLLGTSYGQLFHCTGDIHAFSPHAMTMKDGLPHTVEFYEDRLQCHLEVTTVPYTDPDGTLLGSVHIARDISKRKKLDQEKEKLQARLLQAQKLESVGQLAAGIAHEINTPTQFVGTNIDFLDEAVRDISTCMSQLQQAATAPDSAAAINAALDALDWDYLAEELPRAISQSRDGIKRISSIVRAMKEFSHPGSRDKEPHNLNHIVNTTVTVARNEWKYVAEMVLELDNDLPLVPLLIDEMGQVILNMLVNAAHAIADNLGPNPEGAKGTITLCTRDAGASVELVIRDSGAGIPEAIRARIFDPFFTTKQIGKGTGQGLAISHDVVCVKHGGSISVTSELGQGSEFIISLPKAAGVS